MAGKLILDRKAKVCIHRALTVDVCLTLYQKFDNVQISRTIEHRRVAKLVGAWRDDSVVALVCHVG